jgi:hypothetical protein
LQALFTIVLDRLEPSSVLKKIEATAGTEQTVKTLYSPASPAPGGRGAGLDKKWVVLDWITA